jgi:hypothetical protein
MLYFAKYALIQWKFEAPSKAMKQAECVADHSLSYRAKRNTALTLPPLHHTSPWNATQAKAELCLTLSCSEFWREMGLI